MSLLRAGLGESCQEAEGPPGAHSGRQVRGRGHPRRRPPLALRCLPACFLVLSVLWRAGGLGRSRAECARGPPLCDHGPWPTEPSARHSQGAAQLSSSGACREGWWERDREGRPGMGEGWRGALADPTAGGRSTRLRTQAALWLARQLGEKCGHRAEGGGEAGGRGAGVVPKATLAPGATVVWTSFLSLQGLQAFWVPGWLLLRDQPFPCEQGGLSLGKSPS